jgi:hypothetical protein
MCGGRVPSARRAGQGRLAAGADFHFAPPASSTPTCDSTASASPTRGRFAGCSSCRHFQPGARWVDDSVPPKRRLPRHRRYSVPLHLSPPFGDERARAAVGPTSWSSPDPRTGACRDLANDRAKAGAGGKRWEAFAAGDDRDSRDGPTSERCFAGRAIATGVPCLPAPHAMQAVALARGRSAATRRRPETGSLPRPRRD